MSEHPITKPESPIYSPISALRELARNMKSRPEATLKVVVEKMKGGQSPTKAWKKVIGRARLQPKTSILPNLPNVSCALSCHVLT